MSKGGNMIKVTTKKTETASKTAGSKQVILDLLLPAIQATSAGDDVTALRYDPEKEVVHVDFECQRSGRVINVAMDSGWAMIKDVVKHMDIG